MAAVSVGRVSRKWVRRVGPCSPAAFVVHIRIYGPRWLWQTAAAPPQPGRAPGSEGPDQATEQLNGDLRAVGYQARNLTVALFGGVMIDGEIVSDVEDPGRWTSITLAVRWSMIYVNGAAWEWLPGVVA